EIDLVQVGLEDPVLRPVARQLDREAGLGDLAAERPLVADVEVADELLRDRRAALDDAARADVLPEGPSDALVVDAAVPVEAAILDSHRGPAQQRADLGERHRLAVALGRDRAEERAVSRVDEGVLTHGHRRERAEVAGRLEDRCAAEADDEQDRRYPEKDPGEDEA